MEVVGHQAPSEAGNAVRLATLGHQIAVERIISPIQKQFLPPVAPLGEMVGRIRQDNAGKTGHAMKLADVKIYAIGIMSP